MTRRSLIGPAVVVVVAVLGGVLGTVAAAPPEPREPWTVSTIVQPAVDGLPGSGSDMATSTARIGVTGAAIAANALDILERASSAPDPQAHAQALLAVANLSAPADTCAVIGESPPGGCPAGLSGTVIAAPTARIQHAAVAEPGACGAGDGQVAISVFTDLPAAVTLSWWADALPVRELTVESGTDCILLGELMPDTAYTVHARAGDDWRRFAFDSSGAVTRPGATVYAPTDDLVAVTVPHRPGERVDVIPNVLNGDEPRCDSILSGYDLAVHELGRVTGAVDGQVLAAASLDPAFTERTTVAYDIGEGLTVFLCVVVTTSDGIEDYTAQTIVQTADRLVPELVVTAVDGRDLPGWGLTAWLPSGQRCGAWRPSGPATNREVALELDAAPLCDTTDAASQGGAVAEGRGVLPFSAGNRSTLTVNLDYPQVGASYTTLELGPTAACTGTCLPPPRPSSYVVQGALGRAELMLFWSQGSSNGASETSAAPVTDAVTMPPPGPRLDVATSSIRLHSVDAETRGVTAALTMWADRAASFVARVAPVPGEAACQRPGAVLEYVGELPPEPFTVPAYLRFEGLCHGTEYEVSVELTDADGFTTTWGVPQALTPWGSSSRIAVPTVQTAASVLVQLSTSAGPSAYLTLRVDGTTVIGPRSGGCFGAGFAAASDLLVLPVGETTRFSGVIEVPNAAAPDGPALPCVPFWGSGRRGIPFDIELSWDQLMGAERGTPVELAIVDQSVRGLDDTATVVAIISITPG